MSARRIYAVRVEVQTPAALEELALEQGCCLLEEDGSTKGDVGRLLDKVAKGHLTVTSAH